MPLSLEVESTLTTFREIEDFEPAYPYVAARVKLPGGDGTWSVWSNVLVWD